MLSSFLLVVGSIAAFAAAGLGLIRIGQVWDIISAKQVADLTPVLIDLRLDAKRVPIYLRIWGLSMLGVILCFGVVLQMVPIALAFLYLVYVSPRFIIEYLIRRRRLLLRDQMVGTTIGLANAVKAGLSLAQGIEAICDETPEPLVTELKRISFEFRCGRPLAEAIEEVKKRLKLDSFTLFATAIGACIERGGKITEALARISHSLTENQRLERKLEADTASGRKLVVILACFPFLFLLGFLALDPEGTSKIFSSSIVGQVILTGVIGLVYLSAHWCAKILNIDI